MKYLFLLLVCVGLSLEIQAQESSQARLDAAESGEKDVAWPRKPDSRLSNLSGKMKDFTEIPIQKFGGSKEFRSERLYEDRQASSLASVPLWSMAESKHSAKNESSLLKESSTTPHDSARRFDPVSSRQREVSVREEREAPWQEALGWSSRSSRMGQTANGSLPMYEGRLVRVREQVNRHEAPSPERDLGEGRRERYSPEEVQKLLQERPGLPEMREVVRPALPVRAESPGASRPLAGGS